MENINRTQLIEQLLTMKAEVNNTIDLNAYANGLQDMFDELYLRFEALAVPTPETRNCNLSDVIKSVCGNCKRPISNEQGGVCDECLSEHEKQTVL